MTDQFKSPTPELPRDQWGRPLITPPEGGDAVAYTRVTTFVGPLEDTYQLNQWSTRMSLVGLMQREDLQLAVLAIPDPQEKFSKRKLNNIARDAREASGAGRKALTGTAMHTFTERRDKGEDISNLPAAYRADIDAYADVMVYFEVLDLEGFVVVDHLRTGGSYDRILRFTAEGLDAYAEKHGHRLCYPDGVPVSPGDTVIGDVKTGRIDFGFNKIAMQLGVYSRGKKYDHTTGTRTDLPGTPRRDWGVVIHLPAGEGRAELVWANIDAGYDAAERLAAEVHKWRKRDDLATVFDRADHAIERGPSPVALINEATTYDELIAIHREHALAWTPGLTTLVKSRMSELKITAP